MTLLVGIKCSDGVVVAADSASTFVSSVLFSWLLALVGQGARSDVHCENLTKGFARPSGLAYAGTLPSVPVFCCELMWQPTRDVRRPTMTRALLWNLGVGAVLLGLAVFVAALATVVGMVLL